MAIAGDYYRGPVVRRVEDFAIVAASFGCGYAFYRLSGFETIWPVFVFLAALFFFRRVGSLLLRISGATPVPTAELNRRYIADALREPAALLVLEQIVSLTAAWMMAMYLGAPSQHMLSRYWFFIFLAPLLGFLAGLRRLASLRRAASLNEEQIAAASMPPSAKGLCEVAWRMRSVYAGVLVGAGVGLAVAIFLHLGVPAFNDVYMIACTFGLVLPFLAFPGGMLVLLRAMRARQTFFRTIAQAILMWGVPFGVFFAGEMLMPPVDLPFLAAWAVGMLVFGAVFIGLMVGTLNWIVVRLRRRS